MNSFSKAGENARSLYSDARSSSHKINKDKWIEKFARFGFIAKGIVYSLIGILAVMTAFGSANGEKMGKKETMEMIYKQPFGQVLLCLLAAGLLGYVTWRFVQAFKNPDGLKKDWKGYGKRIGYVISGFIYGAAAFYAVKMVVTGLSGSSGSSGKEMLITKALHLPMGQWIVAIAGVGIAGKGLYQLYSAISEKFMKNIKESKMKKEERKIYKRAGIFGYLSRGVVFMIIGYFIIKAAMQFNPEQAKGTEQALSFLQSNNSYGSYLLGLVALGLVGFGVFMFVKARYKTFST